MADDDAAGAGAPVVASSSQPSAGLSSPVPPTSIPHIARRAFTNNPSRKQQGRYEKEFLRWQEGRRNGGDFENAEPTSPITFAKALALSDETEFETAFKDVRKHLKGSLADAARFFRYLDTNKDGDISKLEFKDGLEQLGVQLEDVTFETLWDRLDLDGDGVLTKDEITTGLFPPASKERFDLLIPLYQSYKDYSRHQIEGLFNKKVVPFEDMRSTKPWKPRRKKRGGVGGGSSVLTAGASVGSGVDSSSMDSIMGGSESAANIEGQYSFTSSLGEDHQQQQHQQQPPSKSTSTLYERTMAKMNARKKAAAAAAAQQQQQQQSLNLQSSSSLPSEQWSSGFLVAEPWRPAGALPDIWTKHSLVHDYGGKRDRSKDGGAEGAAGPRPSPIRAAAGAGRSSHLARPMSRTGRWSQGTLDPTVLSGALARSAQAVRLYTNSADTCDDAATGGAAGPETSTSSSPALLAPEAMTAMTEERREQRGITRRCDGEDDANGDTVVLLGVTGEGSHSVQEMPSQYALHSSPPPRQQRQRGPRRRQQPMAAAAAPGHLRPHASLPAIISPAARRAFSRAHANLHAAHAHLDPTGRTRRGR